MKILKKPVFVSISPNAQRDDVWLALKLWFQPWRWQRGESIQKFTEEFKKYIGLKYVFTFDSGRNSLHVALKALDLKQGDEVLVQAFTCTAAVNPILWLGATPVYVDVEADSYNMSPLDLLRKISGRSRVVIVQHTFGIPANLDAILEIAEKNNLIVIEDVAHALGAKWNGRKVGTFGDVAIFSFGRFKIISAVFSGAVGTNNPLIAKKLESFYKSQPFPLRFWIFQQLFHPVFLSLMKPLYNVFSLGKAGVIIAKKLKLISLTVYRDEKTGGRPGFGPSRMPNALAILGLNQLRKIGKYNEHRLALAQLYRKELNLLSGAGLPKVNSAAQPVYLYFPIQLKDSDVAHNLIRLGRNSEGIYLENWPAKKVIGPQGTNLEKLRYGIGSCPVAEGTALRTVVLPTNPNTREKDARRVTQFIKEILSLVA